MTALPPPTRHSLEYVIDELARSALTLNTPGLPRRAFALSDDIADYILALLTYMPTEAATAIAQAVSSASMNDIPRTVYHLEQALQLADIALARASDQPKRK